MKLKPPFLVKPGEKVRLHKIDASQHHGVHGKDHAEEKLARQQKKLEELQELLYASETNGLLIVLQGMDTAGKDGTIRTIFSGVNPQGCQVASFKVPTALEARHDFLWRCHAQVPPRGMIGIFNRSHYEQALSPRVHGKISRKEALATLDEINGWEQTLTDAGVRILKFYLHITFEEQTERLQARLDDPAKHWKLSPADFAERRFWPDYMDAYEDVLSQTSTKHAPWFVIPANHKWYRSVAIADVLVDALEGLKLKYPAPSFDAKGIDLKAKPGKEDATENPAVAQAAAKLTGKEKKGLVAKKGHSDEESQPISGQQATTQPSK